MGWDCPGFPTFFLNCLLVLLAASFVSSAHAMRVEGSLRAAAGRVVLHSAYDHLGSTSLITNAQGHRLDRLQYGPWGEALGGNHWRTRFTYTGHQREGRTGNYYSVYRYLDPRAGRWTQRDPLGFQGGWNLYGYVDGNPVNGRDPLGLDTLDSSVAAMEASLRSWQQGSYSDSFGQYVAGQILGAGGTLGDSLGNLENFDAITAGWSAQAREQFYLNTSEGISSGLGEVGALIDMAAWAGAAARIARGSLSRCSAPSTALRPVGSVLESIHDVLRNPWLLKGRSFQELVAILKIPEGWNVEGLGQGMHRGQGWVLRQYRLDGETTGRMIRWHPGGGRHGPEPYWRVTSGEYGKSPIIPARRLW